MPVPLRTIIDDDWADALEPLAGRVAAMGDFLRQEVAAGQLAIGDIPRASSQFFALLKGELHARMLCGCSQPFTERDIDTHIRATVEFFLRAYAVDPERLVAL
jgi:TetR/AcrR family transcriptional repressor of mexJK operon